MFFLIHVLKLTWNKIKEVSVKILPNLEYSNTHYGCCPTSVQVIKCPVCPFDLALVGLGGGVVWTETRLQWTLCLDNSFMRFGCEREVSYGFRVAEGLQVKGPSIILGEIFLVTL